MALPINVLDLIKGKAVESERIEYKKGWNPGSIYRSICAFANDFDDIGGGYIIVGIEEENGIPLLPVAGLNEDEIDGILKVMLQMNNLINPVYHPKISVEDIDGKKSWQYGSLQEITGPMKFLMKSRPKKRNIITTSDTDPVQLRSTKANEKN
ncbi:AlbA family DNA-binding domain-containing protein [Arthrospiribacter ruber]|uniref:Schlafen AlbA-2 domain-containing protein n=1 Tax=Arthrospiribacter ruber TaxID=2487934 RepID=A0A951MGM2_9BACT|nr:RNA-binding domain-containing protein [Arthrospiribacter ruber]MBW3469510.1 hypothetical protein [Arthrospiribacter ruber]